MDVRRTVGNVISHTHEDACNPKGGAPHSTVDAEHVRWARTQEDVFKLQLADIGTPTALVLRTDARSQKPTWCVGGSGEFIRRAGMVVNKGKLRGDTKRETKEERVAGGCSVAGQGGERAWEAKQDAEQAGGRKHAPLCARAHTHTHAGLWNGVWSRMSTGASPLPSLLPTGRCWGLHL